jgi:hypothetical protein
MSVNDVLEDLLLVSEESKDMFELAKTLDIISAFCWLLKYRRTSDRSVRRGMVAKQVYCS